MAILFLAALMFIQIGMVHAGIEEAVKRVKFAVHFYNAVDVPPALPYMSIIFDGIPDKETENVVGWQKEINEKLQKQGGVLDQKGYDALAALIPDYVAKFIGTGAVAVVLEFPRRKEGILLYQAKPPSTKPK